MPTEILDTGFLLSLAVDRAYADAVRLLWADRELWVPGSVPDELRVRQNAPRPDIPPELPGRALGIIGSDAWGIVRKDLTDDEAREVISLQERIGGPGSTRNAGEAEGAVLIARRDTSATLALDDASALPVLHHFVRINAGVALSYVHTSSVLEELLGRGHIDAAEHARIQKRMRAKGRPLI